MTLADIAPSLHDALGISASYKPVGEESAISLTVRAVRARGAHIPGASTGRRPAYVAQIDAVFFVKTGDLPRAPRRGDLIVIASAPWSGSWKVVSPHEPTPAGEYRVQVASDGNLDTIAPIVGIPRPGSLPS